MLKRDKQFDTIVNYNPLFIIIILTTIVVFVNMPTSMLLIASNPFYDHISITSVTSRINSCLYIFSSDRYDNSIFRETKIKRNHKSVLFDEYFWLNCFSSN